MTSESIDPEGMKQALKAIYDEALKLMLRDDLPSEVQERLNLIISLARYEFDIRTEEEKRRAADGGTQ